MPIKNIRVYLRSNSIMDLLPGADLELRIYVLLGIVGIMFFAAILSLGVGRIISLKSSSNLTSLSDDSSPFSPKTDSQVKSKKTKKVKPKRSKKVEAIEELLEDESFETVDQIMAEDEPAADKPKSRVKEPKRSRFGKKKQDAIQMLASPSGYVEEYAPTDSRNMDSDYVPSVVEYGEDEYAGLLEDTAEVKPPVQEYVKDEDNWEDDFLTDSSKVSEEETRKRKDTSPFSKNEDWEF